VLSPSGVIRHADGYTSDQIQGHPLGSTGGRIPATSRAGCQTSDGPGRSVGGPTRGGGWSGATACVSCGCFAW